MYKKPTHIALLELLERNGVNIQLNISPYLLETFGTIHNNDDKDPKRVEAGGILQNLSVRKYIEIDNNLLQHTFGWEVSNRLKWFDDEPFNATITITGIDYLNEYRVIESNLELNEATKRTSKTQRKQGNTTITVAIVSVLSALATLGVSIYDRSQSKIQEQSLQAQIKDLQSEQTKLRSLLTSVKDSFRIHPPSSSNKISATLHKK